jgi:hypothetical protein
MSHRTVLGLTGGCLLALVLGACTAKGPTEADGPAAAAPAPTPTSLSTPIQDTKAATPGHTHQHPATSAPKAPAGSGDAPTPAAKPAPPPLYFETPQAAMRYLAAAYNRNDVAALKHVTTPVAREGLLGMRSVAENLRLVGCKANPGRGDYLCEFHHDYPKGAPETLRTGHGYAHFTAAPADKYGWYMTILNDCG